MASPLLTLRVAAIVTAVSAAAVVVQLALRERRPPVQCPEGLSLEQGRCCGLGQTRTNERCVGKPLACGPLQSELQRAGSAPVCVLKPGRIVLDGGKLPLGAADWQLTDRNVPVVVPRFAIDRGEVTIARYLECVDRELCPPLPRMGDLGLPVTGLPPSVAEEYCRFSGGHVPSSAEWRFAASGTAGRRFPWGFTGLVCRRAAFGLLQGPCSREGTGPDLVGARPAGATPEGVLDLAGNVAEWTRDPDGRYRARGGSFRSRVAVELVTAAVEAPPERADYVGFRCAYAL